MTRSGILMFCLLGGGLLLLIVPPYLNRWLPKWACGWLGWHLPPKTQEFNGCHFTGPCPRCGRRMLQDSQGNWF